MRVDNLFAKTGSGQTYVGKPQHVAGVSFHTTGRAYGCTRLGHDGDAAKCSSIDRTHLPETLVWDNDGHDGALREAKVENDGE